MNDTKESSADEGHDSTVLLHYIRDNIDKGPQWLRKFHNATINLTLGGQLIGACFAFSFTMLALLQVWTTWLSGMHIPSANLCAALGASLGVYVLFHPILVGRLHDAVFMKVLPGYAEVRKAYDLELQGRSKQI